MNNKTSYPEGVDISYDIIRLLGKYELTVKEVEHILDDVRENVPKYARLIEK